MPFGPTPVAPGGRGGWAAGVSPGTTIYLSQGRGQSGQGKPTAAEAHIYPQLPHQTKDTEVSREQKWWRSQINYTA